MESNLRPALDAIIIGAAAMDMVVRVDKLPQKDSIQHARGVEFHPGGSGANVAVAVTRLGFKAGFVGKLGNDENGRRLLEEFADEGVDTLACRFDSDRPTAVCFIAIDAQGDRSMVGLGGVGPIESPEEMDFNYLSKSDLVYVTDMQPHIFRIIADHYRERDGMVVFNPGGIASHDGLDKFADTLSLVDVLLLSQSESETLLPRIPVDKAAEELCNLGSRVVVITQGRQGVTYATPDQAFRFPAFNVENVVDTTGAGDAFAGGVLAGILSKKPLEESIRFASAAAAIKVGFLGARSGLPTSQQVDQFLLDNPKQQ